MTGHVGIIGFGSIARDLIGILGGHATGAPTVFSVLVRAGRADETLADAQQIVAGRCAVQVTTDLKTLLSLRPDVIVECAGHGAVRDMGARVLSGGIDLVVASIGALADAELARYLEDFAHAGSAQLILPAGAIGGIDALAAARLSGLHDVVYTGRKPPQAWAGTPAEQAVDLASLTSATVFFEGSARQAATQYPKNANVAATLALAGPGMDETRVRLVADPAASANTHEFSVRSNAVDFTMQLTAKPSPRNPKTSASTVYSIARAVLNRAEVIVI